MMIIKYLETDLLHYYVLNLYESLRTSLSYATTIKMMNLLMSYSFVVMVNIKK